MPVRLHPHQEEAVEKMHNGCILYGGVGTGKTITSLGYYFAKACGGDINVWGSMKTPKDVYVITTAKVRDSKAFEIQAAQYGVHTDPALSTNGVKITVDSWNNLHKYVEVKDAFFIFDEQRVVGYGAWSRAFIKISKSNGFILLSATPGDTWLDYIPIFIANGWYKHKTDFLDQHVIWTPRVKYPKVLRYQNVGVLVRRRNEVLVHMPYERHTTRHHVDIWCDYDQDKFDKAVKQRWHVYENRPLRDTAELFSVMRKVVNSDSSRLKAVDGLLKKHPKLIVFYNFDYELEALRKLAPAGPMVSRTSTDDSQPSRNLSKSSGSTRLTPMTSEGGTTSTQELTSLHHDHKDGGCGCSESTQSRANRTAQADRSTISSSESDSSKNESVSGSSQRRTSANTSGSASQTISTRTLSSAATVKSDDPLFGTIWETGFDEKSALERTGIALSATESATRSTTPATSGSSSSLGKNDESSATPSDRATEKPADGIQIDADRGSLDRKASPSSSASLKNPKSTASKTSSGSAIESLAAVTESFAQMSESASGSFAIAEWNGHKHEEIPTTERWLYLVQYRAGAEGWNCIETDAICFFSQTYSYRDWWQVHGRIDRLNTPFKDLWYYHLVSRSIIDKAIRKALKAKKSFNEKDLNLGG